MILEEMHDRVASYSNKSIILGGQYSYRSSEHQQQLRNCPCHALVAHKKNIQCIRHMHLTLNSIKKMHTMYVSYAVGVKTLPQAPPYSFSLNFRCNIPRCSNLTEQASVSFPKCTSLNQYVYFLFPCSLFLMSGHTESCVLCE